MLQALKNYGAAIGPTLAFVLGLLTIIVKHKIDNFAARHNAERRVEKITAMIVLSPPPPFLKSEQEEAQIDATLTNMVNFTHFYDRMISIQGAIEAAATLVHDHARPETIIRFEKLRRNFEQIMRERDFFHKPERGSPIPGYDNFFNVEQSWRAMLDAAQSSETILQYNSLSKGNERQ